MPRVTPITTEDQVAPEHHGIFDAVAEGRNGVRGPFSILMYSPPLCECVLHSGSFLRFQSGVKPKEGELAIIATAREKDCPYVWAAHVTLARKAGVREEAITAVRERRDVSGLQPDEQAIVTYVRALGGGADRHRGPLRLVTGMLNAFEVAPAPEAEQLPV